MLAAGTQPSDVDPTPFSPWLEGHSDVSPVTGDLDLFGDGSVVLLQTPGHTASHYALLVQLKALGPVILSGDAVHFEENYRESRVPSFNLDRADTLASIDRIRRLVRNLGATLVIQHEPDHVERLPPFPEAAR